MDAKWIDLHLHASLTDPHGVCGELACRQLLQAAGTAGVGTLVLTPHYDAYSVQGSPEQADQILTADFCREAASEITILSAGEFLLRRVEEVLMVKRGQVPTLNNTKYVLVEFLPDARFGLLADCVHELRVLGYLPIIAHPERYLTIQRTPDRALELQANGALLQGTLASLLGTHGQTVRHTLTELLRQQAIACVASDYHGETNAGDYAAVWHQGVTLLTKQLGQATTNRLLLDSPSRILAGQSLMS